MIKVVYSRKFLKSVKKLPLEQQTKLATLISTLAENPYHSLLHTKRLSDPLTGLLSFRITREWRVIFQFLDANTVQLVMIGHRKDIYRD